MVKASGAIPLLWVSTEPIFASLYGLTGTKKLIDDGGRVRVITNIPHSTIESTQQLSDIGEDVGHYNKYRGVYFGVWDRKICLNAINVDVRRISLDEPVACSGQMMLLMLSISHPPSNCCGSSRSPQHNA